MAPFKNKHASQESSGGPEDRVRTVISCPGVRAMSRTDLGGGVADIANENAWADPIGQRRHRYANAASFVLAVGLMLGGLWIVTEFVRLQKLEACFEAGRRDCMALDLTRRQPVAQRD
jgi:hypothetical protein